MNGSPADPKILEIAAAAQPRTIAEVIGVMQALDAALDSADGLKWFNWLYLDVTRAIHDHPPAGGWRDPQWTERLDVVFAGIYFQAIAGFLGGQPVAASWQALFEARRRPNLDRIQFALAGMNAHINHDLSLALVETGQELGVTPGPAGPEHDDFERVNGVLSGVLPGSLRVLATGILGEAAEDTGKIGRLLAIWDVAAARDLAWDFAGHLRSLAGLAREAALDAQDKLTGALGRSLLLPLA